MLILTFENLDLTLSPKLGLEDLVAEFGGMGFVDSAESAADIVTALNEPCRRSNPFKSGHATVNLLRQH